MAQLKRTNSMAQRSTIPFTTNTRYVLLIFISCIICLYQQIVVSTCGQLPIQDIPDAPQKISGKNNYVGPYKIYLPDRNISSRIPPNFVMNTKSGVHNEPTIIQENILNNLRLFPGWKLIYDDNFSCLEKMKQSPIFGKSNLAISWFQQQSTPGMFKSDACRLAQLWMDGGLYLDNDLELVSSLLDPLEGGFDIITAVDLAEKDIFQAILAAPPKHPLIRRSMEKMLTLIPNADPAGVKGWLGPMAVRMAMQETYNFTDGGIDQKEVMNKGVFLLKEQNLDKSNSMMKGRSSEAHCNVALTFAEENGTKVYGFSRVKQYGSVDKKCSRNIQA